MSRSLHVVMEPLEGAKSGLPARRGALRDVGHRASAATRPEGRFGPPKAGFSRPLDGVTRRLWTASPPRAPCLASRRENPVKPIPYQRETI
jgi:hypothetical protein